MRRAHVKIDPEYLAARRLEESADRERVVTTREPKCDECDGSRSSIQGCAACCRDCGMPCKSEKDAEGFHA